MFTIEIKDSTNGLETSINKVHSWYVFSTKIKSLVDGLKTSPGFNLDIIQFSCIYKFCVFMNFFFY